MKAKYISTMDFNFENVIILNCETEKELEEKIKQLEKKYNDCVNDIYKEPTDALINFQRIVGGKEVLEELLKEKKMDLDDEELSETRKLNKTDTIKAMIERQIEEAEENREELKIFVMAHNHNFEEEIKKIDIMVGSEIRGMRKILKCLEENQSE